ncbi:carbohydrate-binding protein, partial [Erwinia sp. V71]|uniref:carbohydrate-binding protein n=1 Tax=Erwinia sp. V71 TaxID=3369424 RepID=UPI003F625839
QDSLSVANRPSIHMTKRCTYYLNSRSGKTYVAGDKVTFDGVRYIASYWTQARPGEHDAWKLADNSQVVEWKAAMTYVAGNSVTWQGNKYTAKQWTAGNPPDTSPDIWKLN